MPDIRIKDITRTVSEPKPSEFIETDHAGDGSGKLDLQAYITSRLSTRRVSDYLHFDGATSGARAFAALPAAANLATSPLTLHTWVYNDGVPKTAITGIRGLSSSSTTTSQTSVLQLYINASDFLRLDLTSASDSSQNRHLSLPAFSTTYSVGWHLISVAWSRVAAPSLYVDGVLVAASESTSGASPPAWTDAIASTFDLFGIRASTQFWRGGLIPVAPINRVQSAAEILAYAQTGRLPDSDALTTGSVVPFYQSDFNAGVDSWTTDSLGSLRTVTGNIDVGADGAGIPPSNDWLRISRISSTGSLYAYRSGSFSGPLAHRYRYTFDVFIPEGSPITNIAVGNTGAGVSLIKGNLAVQAVSAGVVNSIDLSIVNRLSNSLLISVVNSSGQFINVAAGTSFYVKSVAGFLVGPIADWQIQPGGVTLSDSKANRIPLLLTPGVTAIGPKPEIISVLSNPMTADGFVLADQIVTPEGYKLVDAVPTQTGTSTATLTVKETSSGGTTVASGALSASEATVDLDIPSAAAARAAGGKKLHVAASSWTGLTVQLRFNFRRIR